MAKSRTKRSASPEKSLFDAAAQSNAPGAVGCEPQRGKRAEGEQPRHSPSSPSQQDSPAPAPSEKPARAKAGKGPSYATAESMAKAQKSISVSEFFAKNRHLLGFDNPRKALLTTVKEAVDNALDACEEAGILPVVDIAIDQVSENHFKVAVQDNGPGIVRTQIPSIFGQLLYGSKFHRLRMSRGQQGIGISAAGMHGLLTTGKPVNIISRTSKKARAHHYQLQIDTKTNRPDVILEEQVDWDVEHGTLVEIELEAKYQKGRQSVDDYLQQTAIANPHVTLAYRSPDGRADRYEAAVQQLPPSPKEVKPHPHGIELGILIKMMADTKARNIGQFLTSEFSRVSPRLAQDLCQKAVLRPNAQMKGLNGEAAKALYTAIQATDIMAPATDCVVPIGEENLIAGLKQVVAADFYTAATRRPAVYRGNPFIIEAAIAYGRPGDEARSNGDGNGQAENLFEGQPVAIDDDADEPPADTTAIIRFANRVPLQYQQGGCAITKSVAATNWRQYGVAQSRGQLPTGPLTIVVHMASVWVPFTSESKEAIASYPEILKEIRLALRTSGRRLGQHVRRTVRLRQEMKKRSYIERYIPAIGEALRDILHLKDHDVTVACENLKGILERSRKM